ncbi:UNKNOWN [Stylonychia lemnae]|uniref:Uncharacterized protein n=1 Tax=Stylonychia lemnae TaxID=5949 RepID=A0A078ASG6_STYLE|nr:UNKNOWN [Stylonychia lemnae]|eukprot:CDW85114.1 UNKNOWN [Stylonychia lemnae]
MYAVSMLRIEKTHRKIRSNVTKNETQDVNFVAKVNKFDPQAFKIRSLRESLKQKGSLAHDTSDITKDTPDKYNNSSIRQSLVLSPTLLDMKLQTKNQDQASDKESEYTITSIKRLPTQKGKNVIYQESDGSIIDDDNSSNYTQVIIKERNYNSSNSNISNNIQRGGRLNTTNYAKSRLAPQSIMSSTTIKKILTVDSDLQSNTSIERIDSFRQNYINQRSNLTSGRQQTNELQSNVSYTQSGGTMIKHISGSNSNSQINSKNEQTKEIYDGRSYILSEQIDQN